VRAPALFTGGLYSLRDGAAVSLLSSIDGRREITITSKQPKGWFAIRLTSDRPLLGEQTPAESFHYDYLMRLGTGGHFLLTATTPELVDQLLIRVGYVKQIRKPRVRVAELVDDLVTKPGVYVLSAVYGHVDGFGQKLRTISLFGSDIGDTGLFRSLRPSLSVFRVNLRHTVHGQDVLSISQRGELWFAHSRRSHLGDVDGVLGFMNVRGYLGWDFNTGYVTP
jgi:hypothetical protein